MTEQHILWTEQDQQRIDRYAEQVLEAARASGVDLVPLVLGNLQSVGLLMREDLAQRPERLTLYASAIARLTDFVLPSPIPDVEVTH